MSTVRSLAIVSLSLSMACSTAHIPRETRNQILQVSVGCRPADLRDRLQRTVSRYSNYSSFDLQDTLAEGTRIIENQTGWELYLPSCQTSTTRIALDDYLEQMQGDQILFGRGIAIVRARVLAALGEEAAGQFAQYANSLTIVTMDGRRLTNLVPQEVRAQRNVSEVYGYYAPEDRKIYVSTSLPTVLDRLCTIVHELVHGALDRFGGNFVQTGNVRELRPVEIREGFPALIEDQVRIEFRGEFGPSLHESAYLSYRTIVLNECNRYQGTNNQPCTSNGFSAFMLRGQQ
ncbi:hypothetical protein HY990_05990 [Candidatus Micrarchaeota archaeon]|nr:hypothetical protein [Candidatus Micrarchaeota archaeon]